VKRTNDALVQARRWLRANAAIAAMLLCGVASAQTTVNYGRITAVHHVTKENTKAQTAGAIIGGGIGLLSGRHHSRSNQALRTVGGAFAGQQIGRMTSSKQAYEYTVLIGGSTTRVVTDEAGMRVGDCVAVERGGYNNLRLVEDARCNARSAPMPPRPAAVREADACVAAKDKLLQAETTEAFDLAERRVRLLCDD
jgi:outer membrane lipoprotein SlyB